MLSEKELEALRLEHGQVYRIALDAADEDSIVSEVVFRKPLPREVNEHTAKVASDRSTLPIAQERLARAIVVHPSGPAAFDAMLKEWPNICALVANEAQTIAAGQLPDHAKKVRPPSTKPAATSP